MIQADMYQMIFLQYIFKIRKTSYHASGTDDIQSTRSMSYYATKHEERKSLRRACK